MSQIDRKYVIKVQPNMGFSEFSHDLHHAGPAGFSFPQNGLQMLPKVERIVPPFTALSHHKPFIDFSFLV